MKFIYVAVPLNYFFIHDFPPGSRCGETAMRIIWDIPNVKFIRNNHPDGDLYKIIVDDNFDNTDMTILRLKSGAGKLVTNIYAVG